MTKYTIKPDDVGKNGSSAVITHCDHCQNTVVERPFEPLGRVLKTDIGKICKKVNGIWYVENQQQFTERMAKQGVLK